MKILIIALLILTSCKKQIDPTVLKDRGFIVKKNLDNSTIAFLSQTEVTLGGGLIGALVSIRGLKKIKENYTWEKELNQNNNKYIKLVEKSLNDKFPSNNTHMSNPLIVTPYIQTFIRPNYQVEPIFTILIEDTNNGKRKKVASSTCSTFPNNKHKLDDIIANKEAYEKSFNDGLKICQERVVSDLFKKSKK
ncbi:MAG: hypothetical protein ACI9CD_000227 [Candidatus Deianiraeaceae bacterium]|jgi:hypothetical protein